MQLAFTPADDPHLDPNPPHADRRGGHGCGHAVAELEADIAEFQSFMRDVETGKIPVRQGIKGNWASFVQGRDTTTSASYSGRTGPVIEGLVVIVLVQGVHFMIDIGDEEIHPAVLIEIR